MMNEGRWMTDRAPETHPLSPSLVPSSSSVVLDAPLLDLRWTLASGQAFRWRETPDGWWEGVVRSRLLRLRHEDGALRSDAYAPPPIAGRGPLSAEIERTSEITTSWEPQSASVAARGTRRPSLVTDYLRLDDDLLALYAELGPRDPHLAAAFRRFRGLRLVRQEPMETIASYLCATATSIPRIARAVEEMSRLWGRHIATVDGRAHYAFPEPGAFPPESVPALERVCGLGYRARVLVRAMGEIATKPAGWAEGLRVLPYREARAELMALPGIGPKVADCICLFALDKDEAVPVDTHLRQVAVERYMPQLRGKSLTPPVYEAIAERFRDMFGERAGWAQQYLFLDHLLRRRTERSGHAQRA